ncbi:MAG TPA: OmpA family protein [Chryseolinea sp.]|nr:OmpA family protein [Chryseolinea sp.]
MSICARVALTLGIILISTCTYSQSSKELTPGYYIVVAAYGRTQEKVARQYVEDLKAKGHTADYGFNSSRKFYLVYLKYFDNLKESLGAMKNTRQTGTFADAWVRVISGNIPRTQISVSEEKKIESTSPTILRDATQTNRLDEMDVVAETDEIEITDNPEIVQYPVMTLGNTEVFLSLFNAQNNRIVEGEVEVIDTDRAKLITRVKGNEYLVLTDPKSKSGQLTLICDVFGYRKIQQEINYPLPLADTVKDFIDLMGTTLVINFNLVRYHRGDLVTLFNVYFYNDAALMLPESKYELNSLLQLLQENPAYKIRLHGHTNGNYHGKIISIGTEKNFFSLIGSKQTTGSAMDLSYNRADVVKEYLVSNGIDPGRVSLKAWGGRRPLYDKNSANAKKNVRVVVEILED